jgi:hypothetical protein
MLFSNVIRWLGLFAIVGGICRALMTPFELAWGMDNTVALVVGGVTGSIFIILGTAGIYLYQAEKIGVLGFIGFIITTLGNIIVSSFVMVALFVHTAINQPELLEQDLPGPTGSIRLVMLIAMSLGYLLLGYVTLRAKVLPSWAAILMILFVVLPFIPYTGDYLAAVWGIIYIGLGWAVWSKSNVSSNKV